MGKGGNGPGRNGTGGAPEWGPGEGMAGAGPRPDVGLVRGALRVGRLWVVGLGGGDLRKETKFSIVQSSFFFNSPLKKQFCDFLVAFKN